jgi:hypothetical protein
MISFAIGVFAGVVLGAVVAVLAGRPAMDRLRARCEEAEEGYRDAKSYYNRLLAEPRFYAAEWRLVHEGQIDSVISLIERDGPFAAPHRGRRVS